MGSLSRMIGGILGEGRRITPDPERLSRLRRRQAAMVRHPLARLALVYALFTFLLTLYFVLSRRLAPGPALLAPLAALPLGGLFGLVTHLFDRFLTPLARYLRRVAPGSIAAFLLFFIHIIAYLLLFSGLVSQPLGLLLGEGMVGEPTPAQKFQFYSINFVLVLALLTWLKAKHRLVERLLTVYRRHRDRNETP